MQMCRYRAHRLAGGCDVTTFSAQVGKWVSQSQARMDAVRKKSVERVVEIILTPQGKGGRLRVDTGFMRSSFMASTSSMPQLFREKPPGDNFDFDEASFTLVLAGWRAEDKLYAGFTANYAGHREFGSRGQPADLMVTMAAQRWPQIVAEVARELRSRAGG